MKYRIDIFLDEEILFKIAFWKRKWKKKNNSQTIEHMIKMVLRTLENDLRKKKVKEEKSNEIGEAKNEKRRNI